MLVDAGSDMFGANHRKKFPRDRVWFRTFEQSKLFKRGARLPLREEAPHSSSCSPEAVEGGCWRGRVKLRGAADQIELAVLCHSPKVSLRESRIPFPIGWRCWGSPGRQNGKSLSKLTFLSHNRRTMGSCSQGKEGAQLSKAIKWTAASPIFRQQVEVLAFRWIRGFGFGCFVLFSATGMWSRLCCWVAQG